MANKVAKLCMTGELVIFLAIGMHFAERQLACARNDGIASVYVQMPLKTLSEVGI